MTLRWSIRAGPDQAVRRESSPTASAILRLMAVRRSFFMPPGTSNPVPPTSPPPRTAWNCSPDVRRCWPSWRNPVCICVNSIDADIQRPRRTRLRAGGFPGSPDRTAAESRIALRRRCIGFQMLSDLPGCAVGFRGFPCSSAAPLYSKPFPTVRFPSRVQGVSR